MKKKYYPNNWKQIKDAPVDQFPSISYQDFEDWKIYGYQLPPYIFGVLRAEDLDTGKVEEFTYQTRTHAKKRIAKCMKENKTIVMATMDGVYHLFPEPPLDFFNP